MTEQSTTSQNSAIIAVLVQAEIAAIISVPENSGLHVAVKSNATIVDVTNLSYSPAKGSVWNGQDFIIPSHLEVQHGSPLSRVEGQEYFKTFVYLINNVCSGSININPELAQSLAASLSSSPVFLDISSLVENSTNPSSFVGLFLREGSIVAE